ncbi:hypothetical protein H072_9494 [Dactylellina haptotyla CBS 200.50]|uniref:Rad21/Rec8-like protein N-terminal domain-containing protein n=1 Tax=Dactylellina haptotyla (strain CBS 200.50) TaxID=1284197 RepID=S8A1S9_DACHA|nr:hypothetical protein H072_9494 [Dactylellina haptotyla CBS 200.50]
MFYDHRILTQRKYGVATVWLVATIGSRSTLSKKILKKEILEVNLTKACRTIVQSENPLALRLQSSLLFGVSRDVQYEFNTGRIDLGGNRPRPESLLLQDDSGFVPDLAFILPLSHRLPDDQLHHTTQLTLEDKTILPSGQMIMQSQSHNPSFSSPKQLIVPYSSSLDGEAGFQPFLGSGYEGSVDIGDQFDDDIGFVFDENGEIRDINTCISPPQGRDADGDTQEQLLSDGGIRSIPKLNQWVSLSAGSERVQREHEEGVKNIDAERNLMSFGYFQDEFTDWGDEQDQQLFEPFPRCYKENGEDMVTHEPHKAGKRIKLTRADDNLELKTSDLSALGSKYLENMRHARQKRVRIQEISIAKKSALNFIFNWNGMLRTKNLQSTFDGNVLIQLTKPNAQETVSLSKKIATNRNGLSNDTRREESESEGSQYGRRVRGEHQAGNETVPEVEDLDMGALELDYQENEIARRGSPNISLMPWNIPQRGSRAGSVISFGGFGTSSVGGLPSSINRNFSSTGRRMVSPGVSSSRGFGKRGNRLLSSPIIRNARDIQSRPISPIIQSPRTTYFDEGHPIHLKTTSDLVGNDDQDDDLGDIDYGSSDDVHNIQIPQLVEETLEKEYRSFLNYLESQAAQKYRTEGANSGTLPFITFEELVSPSHNLSTVAAQAFHHILALATRGSIRVEQDHVSNRITIFLTT